MNAHLKLSLLKNIKENILHFDDKLVDFERFKSEELNILAKWILSDMETIVLEYNKRQAVNQFTLKSPIQTLNKN